MRSVKNRSQQHNNRWSAQCIVAVISFAVLSWANSTLAVVVTAPPLSDFEVMPGVPKFGVNMDGVVRLAIGDIACTGSLISEQHILTAAHCFDLDLNGAVDADPFSQPLTAEFETALGLETYEYFRDEVVLPENWFANFEDVAVIRLSEIASAELPRYKLYRGSDEIGATTTVVGYGLTGRGASGAALDFDIKIAGQNRFEAFGDEVLEVLDIEDSPPLHPGTTLIYDFDNGFETYNALEIIGFESDLGIPSNEAVASHGDSGGPAFIGSRIAGIASTGWKNVPGDHVDAESSFGELFQSVRVSAFEEFIISATEGIAVYDFVSGDFDNDGTLTANDIDLLAVEIRNASHDAAFDADGTGFVDMADHTFWLSELSTSILGDSNLDGTVEFADFLILSSNFGNEGGWSEGDFDASLTIDFADFLILSANFGKTQTLTQSVPEPNHLWPLVLMCCCVGMDARGMNGVKCVRACRSCPMFLYPFRN